MGVRTHIISEGAYGLEQKEEEDGHPMGNVVHGNTSSHVEKKLSRM